MTAKTWRFESMDTLFFGPGKPMNAGESSWIDSQFPPTGITLQGAIRTAVLYHTNADIGQFVKGENCINGNTESLKDEIGYGKSRGALDLTGPFLFKDNNLLLPAPLDLLKNKDKQFALLTPAKEPVECDLGMVRLPALPQTGGGYKTLENTYIAAKDMAKLLAGEIGTVESWPLIAETAEDKTALAHKEPKIGLARDNRSRLAQDAMLYSIAPVRLRHGVDLRVRVTGIKPEHCPTSTTLQPLGGEGKLTAIAVDDTPINMPDPSKLTIQEGKLCFKLVLTQPALMPVDGWLPQGFSKVKSTDGITDVWQGELLKNCPVTLVSACIGKPLKLGGWDLQTKASKPHRAYIPAGSVYFFEVEAKEGLETAILDLHDSKIGEDTQLGFGHVLVGRW